MSEKHFRRRIVLTLKPLHGLAVENPVYPGTPDVNFIEGWLELKWLPRWPRVGDDDAIRIPHYTPQQRRWSARRWARGGKVGLLLQVKEEHFLFRGDIASEFVGLVSRPLLERLAWRHWRKGLPKQEFLSCLQQASWAPSPEESASSSTVVAEARVKRLQPSG